MKMYDVKSSNLRQIGYDAEAKVMAVVFKNGAVYHYKGVPPEVFGDLLVAPSVGKHFYANVRGLFEFVAQERP